MGVLALNHSAAVGLDIGAHSVKAVALDSAGEVRARARFPRAASGPLGGPEARRIARVLRQQGLPAGRVAVVATRDMMLSAVLELPPRVSGAPVERIARDELARLHSLRPSDVEMVLRDLPPGVRAGDHLHAIAIGLRTNHADELIDALESAGLEPVLLESPGAALLRGAEHGRGPTPSGAVRVVADIGWTGTTVSIATREGIVSQRAIAVGLASAAERSSNEDIDRIARRAEAGAGVNGAFATGSGSPLLDAIESEIDRSLAFAQSRYGVESWDAMILTGGGAALIAGAIRESGRLGELEPEISPDAAFAPALGVALAAQRAAKAPRVEEAAA